MLQSSRRLISVTLHSNHPGEFAHDHAGEAEARGEGLAPAAAMRRAADAVGDLVAPRCGPKLRADDKPKPPRKFL